MCETPDDYAALVAAAEMAEELLAADPPRPTTTVYLPGDAPQETTR
jgi:hypothetical protein